MDADGTTKKKAEKDKKSKKDSGRARWAVQVFCISVVLSGALSFASGAMLYVVFGELLPEASLLWHGKIPALAAELGIITGMVIVYA